MVIDDSFQRPGAIPFSWEIKPGVPKTQHWHEDQNSLPRYLQPQSTITCLSWETKPTRAQQETDDLKMPLPTLQPPSSPFIRRVSSSLNPSFTFPVLPSPPCQPKLKPPPPGPCLHNVVYAEPQTRSFRWTPRALSSRWRSEPRNHAHHAHASPGCFRMPFSKLKRIKTRCPDPGTRSESDFGLEMDSMSPWSTWSRRSASPFLDSPKSSFSLSFRSTPRYTEDPEWAGFGLF